MSTTQPRLRLLVVDDDPLVLSTLAKGLELDGHQVVTAKGGQAGIDAFQLARTSGEPFSAIVTDLGMPGIDGLKLAGIVKSASPATAVLLFTGWSRRADEASLPNVDRVLNKPPTPDELRSALRQFCK